MLFFTCIRLKGNVVTKRISTTVVLQFVIDTKAQILEHFIESRSKPKTLATPKMEFFVALVDG